LAVTAPRQPALESVWHAPLVPAALAITAGIVADRYVAVPLVVSLVAALVCLAAWLAALPGKGRGLALVYLALAGVAFGAAWHHFRRDATRPDDIGVLAPDDPRPAQVRGILETEPLRNAAIHGDPLRSRDRPESASAVLAITQLRQSDSWVPITGRLRLLSGTPLEGLHAGDVVEAAGRIERIRGPANPGEFDQAAHWRDCGARAQLVVRPAPEAVVRLERGWPTSLTGSLAVVRGWGQGLLTRDLPEGTGGLAAALLLGEGAPLGASDWDKYIRTGVVHVLAISGQHLVILAWVLWAVLRMAGVRQRYGAMVVGTVLFAYALLTGFRPPASRAAVMVGVACAALVLRRRTLPANAFALAWLTVGLLDPADLFGAGCQLSFLSVAILYWGTRPFLEHDQDALGQLIEESRPAWQRAVRRLGREIGTAYLVTIIIWLAITPLAAARYHLISPIGIALGPPLGLLTSLALIAGFLMLTLGAVVPPLATVLGPVVHFSLAACERLVDWGAAVPGGYFYIGDIPEWWLALFYLGLLALLTQAALRERWRWVLSAGLGWLCVGLVGAAARLPADELRVTFLAVGHGGCTVLELPDGRTLIYDAGAIGGPDVTRRQIAPFLWHRGIRRVDEIFLSHADLDHFNGLPDLCSRFTVGHVSCTPTFADKSSSAVVHTLATLQRHGIATRIVKAGDFLDAGTVTLEVLHPPAEGPAGNENARSLVLVVRHAGHTLLLTGDLEGAGLERMMRLPPLAMDIVMAPHHGSRRANTPELAAWCRPRVAVSCQGPPPGWREGPEPYTSRGARFLGTWPHGAVTVRSHGSGLAVETFVTGERFVVRSAGRGE
jgi:competence protein ComEC